MTGLFYDYLLQGRMDVKGLVTSCISPLDAPKAYQQLLQNRSSQIGILLDWDQLAA
jgi:threonine dehydrogenase-like Zn-dependent dehydrogenase